MNPIEALTTSVVPPARRQPGLSLALVLGTVCALPAAAQQLAGDLSELSLDELLGIEVTSVSKREQPLSEAAAAIFAITGEDLRRAGVRTLADAMRLVPGMQVVRSNAHTYSVAARGFSGDKLEVLLDGRSVYTPLTSTVFWDVLDTPLSDVERIEVIRGPGATLWGANAVNGVINIVTRKSADTVGTLVHAGGGTEERSFASARTGSAVGPDAHVRLYASARERDSSIAGESSTNPPPGDDALDGLRQQQAGFRSDWSVTERTTLTLSGDIYDADLRAGSLSTPGTVAMTTVGGHNFVARGSYRSADYGEWTLQAYYDGYRRVIPEVFAEDRDTYDVELQHNHELGARSRLTWGLGYRETEDVTGEAPLAIIFDPASRRLRTVSAFLQDQIRLFDRGELTLGTKVEHNDFTGEEWQPGLRLGWTLGEGLFTWASVAHAVRTPNRLDSDIAIFCSAFLNALGFCDPAGSTLRIGNANLRAERVFAYEWGLRFWTEGAFTADLATFYNDYSDLRGTETTPPPFGSYRNSLDGVSYGGELALGWQPLAWLQLRPFYALLKINLEPEAGSTDVRTEPNTEGGSPQQTAGLRASIEPLPTVAVEAMARYVDPLPALAVPAYTQLNLRVAWQASPKLEFAVVGHHLLDPQHPESGSAASSTQPVPRSGNEIERGVFAELQWSWQ